jgi:hypothetical protein
MGFFAWLREGVRRAVLLGFSDAINEIGNRSASDELGPQLTAAWQQGMVPEQGANPLSPLATPISRKRLGKSLAQIREAAQT